MAGHRLVVSLEMLRMRVPRNGSPTANALLLLVGLAAGMGVSAFFDRPDRPLQDFVRPREGMPDRRPSAREIALDQRVGGRSFASSKQGSDSQPLAFAENPDLPLSAQERGEHFRKAGAEAAREDLRHALASAVDIKSAQDRMDFYRGVFGVWAKDDPVGALAHAKSELSAGPVSYTHLTLPTNREV